MKNTQKSIIRITPIVVGILSILGLLLFVSTQINMPGRSFSIYDEMKARIEIQYLIITGQLENDWRYKFASSIKSMQTDLKSYNDKEINTINK